MPASARWCGHCGGALLDERAVVAALAITTGRDGSPATAADVPFAEAAPVTDERPPDDRPADLDVEDGPTRASWGLRLAALLAVVLSAGLTVLLLRPGAPGLDEVRPTGWGSADGRDAARTGAVVAAAIDRPDDGSPIDQWGFSSRRDERWYDVSIMGPAVLVRQDDGMTVLRRDDGGLVGTFPDTYEAQVMGDLLVTTEAESGHFRLIATRITTGEPVWSLQSPGTTSNLMSLGEHLLVAVAGVREAPTLVDVSPDGRIRAELSIVEAGWSVYVADAYDGLAVVQALRDDAFAGGGEPGAEDFAQFVVDLAAGTVRRLPGDLSSPWEGGSLVLLGDGRGAVAQEGGAAREVDLATGELRRRLPALDGGSFWGVGDYLAVVEPEGTSRLLRRRDLEVLWMAGGYLDLSPLASGAPVVTVHQAVGGDWLTSWRAVETGVHLTDAVMNNTFVRPAVDEEGVVEVVDGVLVARTHAGESVWTRRLVEGPASSLQAAGDVVVASHDGAHLSVDRLSGERRQSGVRVSRSGVGSVPWIVVAGQRVIEVRGELLLLDDELSDAGATWRQDLDATITATVAGDEVVWVAAGQRLVAVDPADGSTVGEVEAIEVSGLSLAGGEALVAVANAACFDGEACAPTVRLFDPQRLVQRWAVEVPGACGGATLAGDVVAVPTVDGLAFLDRGDGSEVGRWRVDRRGCLEAAHLDGRFVLPATGGLVVGDREGIEASVLVDAPVTTAPVVLDDGQVLVGTTEGITAVDLELLEVDWTATVDGGVVAPPLVVDGRLYVLTPDRVVRLR